MKFPKIRLVISKPTKIFLSVDEILKFAGYSKYHWFVISQIFAGNTDRNTVIAHSLKPHIEARYIRFHSQTHNGNVPCLRTELYGCRNGKSFI